MVCIFEFEIILFLEVCKYLTGYIISQKEISLKIKRSWGIVGGLLLLVPFIIYKLNDWSDLDIYMMLYVCAVLAIICIMDIPIKSRIWQSAILVFCLSSIDGVIGSVFEEIDGFADLEFELQTIMIDLMTLTILLVVFIAKQLVNKKLKEKREVFYSTLAQGSFIMCGFLQCLNACIITSELSDRRKYYVIGLFSYLGVAFLGSQIMVVLNMNSRMKELIKEERILHTTQKKYYQSLLEREDETRKYRHDMTNHLMIMDTLLNDDSIDELKEYMGELRKEFGTVQGKRYVTGNAVIDAISSYYLPEVDEFADIKIRGRIPSDMKIDEVSICTIYSNLVKNAVEELRRLKDTGNNNLKIFIDFKAGEEFFSISVKNTMRQDAVVFGIYTPTSKKDCRNHGIGLGNIKRSVEKEHGRFNIEKKENMFIADVILPRI